MTQPGPTPAEQPVGVSDPVSDPAPDPAVVVDADGAGEPEEERKLTLLEQMGGVAGLVYSSVPVLVFVALYLPTHSLAVAIWSSVGAAVAILILRLVRREPIQPAISGLFSAAVAALIAYWTGSARGYFLLGIWTSLLYGGVFLASVVVRYPLAGVLWSLLNGTGRGWRADRPSRRYYNIATAVWAVVFAGRFVVQEWLYSANQVGWLAFARLAMGWPLAAIGALVTVWAVRRADQRLKAIAPPTEDAATA